MDLFHYFGGIERAYFDGIEKELFFLKLFAYLINFVQIIRFYQYFCSFSAF